MTPEEIKKANGLIEQIEGLEKVLTLLGSDDIDRISLHRKSTGSHYIDGDTFTKVRAGIEELINRQRLQLMQELATKYNVRAVA